MSDIRETLGSRAKDYGHFRDGAALMQALKATARGWPGWEGRMAPYQREAVDMILHKLGRILNGNPDHIDSWHDIAGYATLVERILSGENP